MTYDPNGIGIAEIMQVFIYYPEIAETIDNSELSDNEKLLMYQKTIDLHNEGLL